jgi:glycosyltransferase involved in cell wall biosynthesis
MSLVTIILTTLNSERFVARSLESCLNQTHSDVEVLVVDGGSQDRTLEIVGSCTDPRIRIIHQEGNAGKLPGAINLGMANARGDLLTWTQDDSWYEPKAIETMVRYLNANPDVDLVYTDYWDVDENGRRLRYQRVNPPELFLKDDVIRQCFLFRRAVYEAIGPQDTEAFPVHEVPWRISIIEEFQVRPLHVPLLNYTVHTDSLTGRIGNRELRRMTASLLWDKGYFDEPRYRRRLAEIDILEAYGVYIWEGDYSKFLKFALLGIKQDWRWLTNLGLLKLMLISLMPVRESYRVDWVARWKEDRFGDTNSELGRRDWRKT